MAGMGANQMALKRAMDTINNPGLYGAAAAAMARHNLSSLRSMADFETAKDNQESWAMQERDHSLGTQLKALGKGAAVLGGGLGLAQGVMGLAGNAGAAAGASGAAPAAAGGTGGGSSFLPTLSQSTPAATTGMQGLFDSLGLGSVPGFGPDVGAAMGVGSQIPSWMPSLSTLATGASSANTLNNLFSDGSENMEPGSFGEASTPSGGGNFLDSLLSGVGTANNFLGKIQNSPLGNLLGTGLSTYLGYDQAKDYTNALQGIADQGRADRLPFLKSAQNMLANPGEYYKSPEVMGGIDASLRGLSAGVGNPINNPGAIAKQSAYNTGNFNNVLNSRAALGLGGQSELLRAQQQAALAGQGPQTAIASGIGSLLNPKQDLASVLAQYLQRG